MSGRFDQLVKAVESVAERADRIQGTLRPGLVERVNNGLPIFATILSIMALCLSLWTFNLSRAEKAEDGATALYDKLLQLRMNKDEAGGLPLYELFLAEGIFIRAGNDPQWRAVVDGVVDNRKTFVCQEEMYRDVGFVEDFRCLMQRACGIETKKCP